MELRIIQVLALVLLAAGTGAADWPGFRGGPRGDGVSAETALLQAWPTNGPPLVWRRDDLPESHAQPVVVDGTIFLAGKGVTALSLADGRSRWQTNIPTGSATPAVSGGRLFVQDGGTISALDVHDGKKLWSANLSGRDRTRYDCFAGSPVVADGKVYWVTGQTNAPVVALDQVTGKVVWTAQGAKHASNRGWSTPALVEHRGRKLLLAQTAWHVLVVDAVTGSVLAEEDLVPAGPGRNAGNSLGNVPVFADGLVFTGCGYGGESTAWRLTESFGPEKVWQTPGVKPFQESVLCFGGKLHGCGSVVREKRQREEGLVIQEVATGKVLGVLNFIRGWQAFSAPMMTSADERIYMQWSWGRPRLYLLEANDSLGIRGEFNLPVPPPADPKKQAWVGFTAPVIADGRLLVRYGPSLCSYNVHSNGGTAY